jgi:DNA repair exonuclease SbcCD nuclease subunit
MANRQCKIGVIGDLHLTNRSPERRLDDYYTTLLRKLNEALSIFENEGCDYAIQVGDFFDSPTVANRVKSDVIKLLLGHLPILSIYGQHDITGHSASTFLNSPLAVIHSAGVVQVLHGDSTSQCIGNIDGRSVVVHGVPFGQNVPVPDSDDFNVLVVHDMIGDRPLYPGQPLASPKCFLRAHSDFNVILCGDYHYSFEQTYDSRLILNPGAIPRKNLTDVKWNHSPQVCIVEVPSLKVSWFPLTIEPVEKVFDLGQSSSSRSSNGDALNSIIQALKESRSQVGHPGWKGILSQVLNDEGVDLSVRNEIDSALQEMSDGR